jgi:hypothetical protein
VYQDAKSQLSRRYQKSIYTVNRDNEESKHMSMAQIYESDDSSDEEDVDEEGSIQYVNYQIPQLRGLTHLNDMQDEYFKQLQVNTKKL